jgi:DNA-binding FrmR family transcriptional regulator
MIENRLYCVDILNQIHAVISALARVEDRILEKHFEGCLNSAVQGKSSAQKKEKLAEILRLIHQFRKV